MGKKKKIKCSVDSCLFQNSPLSLCSLEEVVIGTVNTDNIAFDSLETVCKSFIARNNEEYVLLDKCIKKE